LKQTVERLLDYLVYPGLDANREGHNAGFSAGHVALFSALLGFYSGAFGFPAVQDAVEGGQIIAGVVDYSTKTPYYSARSGTWTILHQVLGLLIHFGIPEKLLSYFVSGLQGLVSFTALSLCTFAFCRSPLLSIASPVLITLSNATSFPVHYPVVTMGITSAYGVIGRSYSLLVASVLSLRCYRVGGILLGLSPCVHPPLGLFLWAIMFLCLIWDYRNVRDSLKNIAPYFLIGCVISIISFLSYRLTFYGIKSIGNKEATLYLHAFIRGLDCHRIPVRFQEMGIFLNICIVMLCSLLLYSFRSYKDKMKIPSLLLCSFIIYASLGLIFALFTWIPIENTPNLLLKLMPHRLLNFGILGFCALLIGLLASYRKNCWKQLNLVIVLTTLLVLNLIGWSHGFNINVLYSLHPILAITLFGSGLWLIISILIKPFVQRRPFVFREWDASVIHALTKIVAITSIILFVIQVHIFWKAGNGR